MAAGNTETQVASPAGVTYCGRMKTTGAENGTFVYNLMDHFHEFVHTPMAEHKACFKYTLSKIIGKFTEKASSPREGENQVAPLQTTPKKK